MKKLVLLLFLTLSFLYAKDVSLNIVNNLQRKAPTSKDFILSYNNILKKVKTSVVNISTQKNINTSALTNNPFFNDPFFRQFFGQGIIPKERVQRALGSGVIISSDGYIVTNNHVVEGADKIKVSIAGSKKEYDAKLIGTDAKSDIAIIKIEAKNLNAITFYNSDDVKVGDVVFAIGNPFGVGETMTQGIVSATGRDSVGITEYENFIQTDAPINPGNSGGALINSAGYLIGINSAIISRSGGNVGIGFAIPSNMVRNVAKELIDKGKYTRAYLGVNISNITEDMSSFYNNKYGALITAVQEDTPASKAGLKRGDLIIAIDNKKVESASELKNIIGSYQPNSTINVTFIRDKKLHIKKVKLSSQDKIINTDGVVNYKGLEIVSIDTALSSKLGLNNIKGVLVKNVKPKSKAQEAGFANGDVIVQVENIEIKTIKDFQKAIKPKGKKRIYIYRQGAVFAVVL